MRHCIYGLVLGRESVDVDDVFEQNSYFREFREVESSLGKEFFYRGCVNQVIK